MVEVDLPALQIACRTSARQALWSEKTTPELAVAKLSREFLQLAADHVITVTESGRDPNMVTRAINYLAYTHVAPSAVEARWWFNEMLTCLLELAVPSMIQTPESSAFLLDVQDGLAGSIGPAED
jgi:hypothetical protein